MTDNEKLKEIVEVERHCITADCDSCPIDKECTACDGNDAATRMIAKIMLERNELRAELGKTRLERKLLDESLTELQKYLCDEFHLQKELADEAQAKLTALAPMIPPDFNPDEHEIREPEEDDVYWNPRHCVWDRAIINSLIPHIVKKRKEPAGKKYIPTGDITDDLAKLRPMCEVLIGVVEHEDWVPATLLAVVHDNSEEMESPYVTTCGSLQHCRITVEEYNRVMGVE